MHSLLSTLAQVRRSARLTLSDLAQRTGVPAPRLSLLFGDHAPDARLSTVQAVADALDCEVLVVPNHLVPLVRRMIDTGETPTHIIESPSALQQTLALHAAHGAHA